MFSDQVSAEGPIFRCKKKKTAELTMKKNFQDNATGCKHFVFQGLKWEDGCGINMTCLSWSASHLLKPFYGGGPTLLGVRSGSLTQVNTS